METNKKLLNALMASYLYNLVFMPMSDRCTVTGQAILSNQLSEIANATNVNTKNVHDTFDSLACDVRSGNALFNNAVLNAQKELAPSNSN